MLVWTVMALSGSSFADTATANRQTVVNNVTDYVATVGRSGQDQKEILQERRDLRREARIKKQERKKRAEMRKRMKRQEEAIMRKIRTQ